MRQTDKAKPVVRRGRKATGLVKEMGKEIAGLPKRGEKPGFYGQKIAPGLLRIVSAMAMRFDEILLRLLEKKAFGIKG